ncbi:hypothetical protein B0T26DRAFT_633267 [Lasiosphaeria miniovina]|uniref:RRM domain-containing protein n=1 Tax=Lasiosphaeria miniovina TaxID=1954250 RepID=A0AA40BGE2_9PEZI|nr:uncharacterized protein B0T26DRAFT_633267 [Lasiosphaeria miniovina]KAK0733721.1 hypothetical protein B0T26DRAFT_633267 [Lasiosphaeria miniovina]
MALLSPVKTSNDRRMARSVTTGGPMGVNSQPPVFLRNQLSYTSVRHQSREIDAQGLYPSTACVFVANLPEPKDDYTLEAAVTRVFSRYGTVFVKIRRDNKHMPFAFCQFTKNEDAKTAMEQGKGAMIFGRPCRTEMVKANCSFIVWKRRGGDTTVDEVREVLEPFGELTKCEPLDDEVRHAIRIRSAVHVEFSNFDPSRDLGSGVRQYGEYQIDPFDPKKKLWGARPDADKEYLKQYDVDRRTVYVTGLPLDVDDAEMTDFFSEVGQVSKVHIVKRPGYDVIYRAFAFVEYARGDMPDKAVDRFRNDVMRGHKLKVERKISKHQMRTPRRVKSFAFLTGNPSDGIEKHQAANPKTPAAFEGSEQSPAIIAYGTHMTPASAPPTQGFMMYPGVGHQMLAPGYINTPTGPHGPVFGYNGMPVTPSPVPTGYAPYMGAYWPGVPSSQDRTAGMPHGLYGSPSNVGGAMVPGSAGPNYTPVHYGANFGEDVGNDKSSA